MRPIERGKAPNVYVRYQDALRDLASVIGDYCSYCERFIDTHLAVEHVQPKSRKAALATSWTNFLLACVNCNSCKGKRSVKLVAYFWPDADNTCRCLTYSTAGRVSVAPWLSAADTAKAQKLVKLVGLDKEPGHPTPKRRPTKADLRWKRRMEAWDKAVKDRAKLAQPGIDTPALRELIAEKAAERGMFSIWMTVFAADSDMRLRLIQQFMGTATNCFDALGNPVARPGGSI